MGYYSSLELKACEDDGITAYVPVPAAASRLAKKGRFSLNDFTYDGAADAYTCPAGQLLHPMARRWQNTSGRTEIRYASSCATCKTCQLKARCLSPKARMRTIARWEHEDVLERHRARMEAADELMRRRSALVEHPFGTLKCRAGYRHFLLRGFDKVRGEWSLMALCYNFTRVLNILGFEAFVALVAKTFRSLWTGWNALAGRLQPLLEASCTNMPLWRPIRRFSASTIGQRALLAQPRRRKWNVFRVTSGRGKSCWNRSDNSSRRARDVSPSW
jgi:Transposase DDE domain